MKKIVFGVIAGVVFLALILTCFKLKKDLDISRNEKEQLQENVNLAYTNKFDQFYFEDCSKLSDNDKTEKYNEWANEIESISIGLDLTTFDEKKDFEEAVSAFCGFLKYHSNNKKIIDEEKWNEIEDTYTEMVMCVTKQLTGRNTKEKIKDFIKLIEFEDENK